MYNAPSESNPSWTTHAVSRATVQSHDNFREPLCDLSLRDFYLEKAISH